MRAAAADHAAIVQSGAIATTPSSRLSNKSFASMSCPPPKNTTPRWPYRGRNGADDAAQEHYGVELPGPLSSGGGCSDDATPLELAEQAGAVAQLGGPAGTVSTSGITSAAKR